MKILLFGGSGQLGYEVIKRAGDLNFDLIAPHETEVDLGDLKTMLDLARKFKPEIVINCAAYTAVDKAEEQPAIAYKVNQDGARNVAECARDVGARMIHISTDYVFDGTATRPIVETEETNPINVYGGSKLGGELEVLKVLGDKQGLILRTQSLHGQKGQNFVHTMIKLFGEQERLKVVSDQYMCATWAGWLAEVILDFCRISAGGIFHASGAGVISWHEFACGIYEMVKPRLKRNVTIEAVKASEFSRPAKRPAYSALDCSKLSAVLGRKPISWQEGLRRHLADIGYKV